MGLARQHDDGLRSGVQAAQLSGSPAVEVVVLLAADREQRPLPLPDAGPAVQAGQGDLAAERQDAREPWADPVRLGHREEAAVRRAAQHHLLRTGVTERGRGEQRQLGAGLVPVEQRHAVRRRELLGVRQHLADVAVVLRTEHDATGAGADDQDAGAVALAGGGADELAAGVGGAVRPLGQRKAVLVDLRRRRTRARGR